MEKAAKQSKSESGTLKQREVAFIPVMVTKSYGKVALQGSKQRE